MICTKTCTDTKFNIIANNNTKNTNERVFKKKNKAMQTIEGCEKFVENTIFDTNV